MKRSLMFLAAMAFTVLAGCQSEKESEVVPDNPNYDPETNTVKTEFVLNISSGTGKDTKTTAEFAQVGDDAEFLGMEAVHLLTYNLPFTSTNHGNFFYKPVHNYEIVETSRDYNLGSLFPAKAVTSGKASRTLELALPLGTNCVVLYGKALKTYSDDLQGKIEIAGDLTAKDLTKLTFSLTSRLSSQSAFDAGAFFFSKVYNYLLVAGLADERGGTNSVWANPIGSEDKSYKVWFPVPSDAVLASLPSNPTDGQEAVGSDGVTYTFYTGQVTWKQLGRMYDYAHDTSAETKPEDVVATVGGTKMTLSALTEVVGEAYSALTTIKEKGTYKELRAGSAASVIHVINDLYSIAYRASEADPTSWEEQVAKLLGIEIINRMKSFFALEASGSIDFIKKDGAYDITTLMTNLEKSVSPTDWNTYSSGPKTLFDQKFFATDNTNGFPINIGLPFGAAVMACTVETDIKHPDQFSYMTNIPAYGMENAYFPITNYRYPAELMYWGNSAIRTSTEVKNLADYPGSVSAWDTEAQWTGWESYSAVKSTTRSVAMINNINYGTALLASTVKFKSGVTALLDNNAALHPGESNKSISIDDLKFKVTGIMIGGQPDVVGWDFTRYPDDGAYGGVTFSDGKFNNMVFSKNDFNKMIYDKVTTPFYVGSNNVIYTMAWDNYDATKTADEQADVYVGLELLNEGEDFWGEMNLVRKGGTFYLLGKLDLSTAVENASADAFSNLDRSYYCYPPFDPSNGQTINVPRVFMQDYMTTADLELGATALQHAYVTVPDLRSSQVSLGVSIDMKWTPGLAFVVPMGGATN